MVTCADLADHWDQVIARFLLSLGGDLAVPTGPVGRNDGRQSLPRLPPGVPADLDRPANPDADAMVTFELYPWHSTAVTASMRPDPGVVREFVWQPIRELGAPVFAFGAPWFGLLEDGLVVVAERHSGSAGPPRRSEAQVLREAIEPWLGEP